MTEPKRWAEDGASAVVGQLLRAAAEEQPTSHSLERALAGVTAAGVVTGSASAAAGSVATAKGMPLASAIFAKWMLYGVVATLTAGGLGLGARRLLQAAPAAPSPAQGAALALPSTQTLPSAQALRDSPSTEAPTDARPARATAPAAPGVRASHPSSVAQASSAPAVEPVLDAAALAQETQLVDHARAELGAGHAGAALATLDEYQARFPQPRYAPEALYLRMEALLASGNAAAARQVAGRLASRYPNGPHAARAEALLKIQSP
jgi:hypothetical protein